MKTGYVNPRRSFSLKAQAEILLAAGVPENRIYVQGERGEDLAAACKAARDKLVHCADGMRALGASAKAIREAMALAEKHGAVIVDAARNQRSDHDRWKMYDWACGKVIAEKNGLTPRTSRKGAQTRAAMIANDRLEDAKAERIWKDQRFGSNEEACAYMNKLHPPKLVELHSGWTPQIAFRNFGGSDRPRGNKSFKLQKRK